MSLNGVRLGALIETALVVSGASSSPATAALGLAIGSAVVSELTGHAVIPGLGLVAPSAAGPVTGASTVTGLLGSRLSTPIRSGLVAAGAQDFAPTTSLADGIANAVVNHVHGSAAVPALGLLSTNTLVSPGVVTGTASISSMNPVTLALTIKNALVTAGAADGAATATLALSIASAIVLEVHTFAVVNPTSFVSPAGGGPITGTGTVS